MRKLFHIIISFTLVLTTSGITVSAHYCQNRLIEKKIDGNTHSCCNKDNCCRNESVTYRITDDFAAAGFQMTAPVVFQTFQNLNLPENLLCPTQAQSNECTDLLSVLKLPRSFLAPDLPQIQTFLL